MDENGCLEGRGETGNDGKGRAAGGGEWKMRDGRSPSPGLGEGVVGRKQTKFLQNTQVVVDSCHL
jgi:hypothetical protein